MNKITANLNIDTDANKNAYTYYYSVYSDGESLAEVSEKRKGMPVQSVIERFEKDIDVFSYTSH